MKRLLLGLAVIASLALFFWKAFLPGWTRQTTDFPNYYTAARLVRQGAPLRLYYDWIGFQRQIGRAGIEGQLGSYIPQTPLTMIPVIPMAAMKPQNAKRAWLVLSLVFLLLTIELLSRITGFRRAVMWLLVFACWEPLRSNFVLGQYYVFLLFLFAFAAWALARDLDSSAGTIAGLILGLKLYAAPLMIWFAAQRRWRAAAGMAISTAACAALSILLFGWQDVWYFAAQVLPRALQGETLNPYHPGNGTLSTLLRVSLIAEPELNPHPLFHAPAAFFFLQPLVGLTLLAIPLLSAASLAWFLVALLIASPNTASYTFILLALPVALALNKTPKRQWLWLLAPYIAIGSPLPASLTWAFPRLWLLCALYIAAGRGNWKSIHPRAAAVTLTIIILLSCASMLLRVRSYDAEPARSLATAVSSPNAIFSAFPAVTPAGRLVYDSISNGHYVLKPSGDSSPATLAFAGEAFHPSLPDGGSPVYFEVAVGGNSWIAALGISPAKLEKSAAQVPNPADPAVSHDGKLLAVVSGNALFLSDGNRTRKLPTPLPVADPSFVPGDRAIVFSVSTRNGFGIYLFDLDSSRVRLLYSGSCQAARPSVSADKARLLFASTASGPWQIWIADLASGRATRITGGNCNNSTPAWSGPDQILFASDCGRGLGLPALYRLDHLADALPKRFDSEAPMPFASARGR
ncbi:MAG TPA: glycosyltransferase 87 family protein [Bryobacteraceae bacterium]|jgi:hypothetical protein|nr:glycosyltransferase 87 family protein [Bryobacteraceae bacterium]